MFHGGIEHYKKNQWSWYVVGWLAYRDTGWGWCVSSVWRIASEVYARIPNRLRASATVHSPSTLGYVHTYTFSKRSVFEKIRFGVSTRIVRQSGDHVHTDVDWSQETCLHLKIRASVYGLASSSNRTFLFVSFARQCCSSVLPHVLVPRGRTVRSLRIRLAGDKRKATKAKWSTIKRRSKMKKKKKHPTFV